MIDCACRRVSADPVSLALSVDELASARAARAAPFRWQKHPHNDCAALWRYETNKCSTCAHLLSTSRQNRLCKASIKNIGRHIAERKERRSARPAQCGGIDARHARCGFTLAGASADMSSCINRRPRPSRRVSACVCLCECLCAALGYRWRTLTLTRAQVDVCIRSRAAAKYVKVLCLHSMRTSAHAHTQAPHLTYFQSRRE